MEAAIEFRSLKSRWRWKPAIEMEVAIEFRSLKSRWRRKPTMEMEEMEAAMEKGLEHMESDGSYGGIRLEKERVFW